MMTAMPTPTGRRSRLSIALDLLIVCALVGFATMAGTAAPTLAKTAKPAVVKSTARHVASHRVHHVRHVGKAVRHRATRVAKDFDDGSRPQRPSVGAKPAPTVRTSLTGGGIDWRVSSGCLAGNLRAVIQHVAATYGSVTVNSTCRSPSHNRAVGGAPKSWHLKGLAADIRVHGNYMAAASYMRPQVGGCKHYGGGRFHIDNGPKRTF